MSRKSMNFSPKWKKFFLNFNLKNKKMENVERTSCVSRGIYTYNLSLISSRLVCFSFGMTNYRTSRPDDSPTHTQYWNENKKKKKKNKIKRKEKDFIFILNFGVVRRHGSIHQLHTTTTRAHQLYYIKVYRLFKEIEPMTKI